MSDASFPYRVLVHWNDFARAFVARVPALPDCLAAGGNAAEAIEAARTAARRLLEELRAAGGAIPAPDAA